MILAAAIESEFPLRAVDAAIVAVYLLAMLAIGVWASRGQKSTADYFLGDRAMPGWTVLLSIVATETSTVTFLSIPGMAYAANGDMRFLQITFGYIVGRVLVAVLLLPLYFRGEPFTAYEVLGRRFGPLSRRATSALFLVTRNLGDGLRLYLGALVLHTAMGLDLAASIVVMGVITVIYTYVGGVKSVVWNDCVQFAIYICGAAAALWHILSSEAGGFSSFENFAHETDKLRVLDFQWSLTKDTMTFWAGLIGGMFLTLATHGTDQLNVQRLLTARSQRSAAAALVLSGVVVLAQFALFLMIGAALAWFGTVNPGAFPADMKNDRVFAHFIVNYLPVGLVGLTLAAVFAAAMSTLSGSLNSSATTLISDLVVPLRKTPPEPATQLRWARLATAVFGAVQIGVALAAHWRGADESTVNQVLKIASFASGPVLGLYLLGVLTRVSQPPALGGFVVGVLVISAVALRTDVYWPWYAAIGAAATFFAGVGLSVVVEEPAKLNDA
jgi:solute:Na+ symporter, SSS family